MLSQSCDCSQLDRKPLEREGSSAKTTRCARNREKRAKAVHDVVPDHRKDVGDSMLFELGTGVRKLDTRTTRRTPGIFERRCASLVDAREAVLIRGSPFFERPPEHWGRLNASDA